MRHVFLITIIFIILLLLNSSEPVHVPDAHAQQPPPGAYEDNIVLNVMGNFRVGGSDWMTSADPHELGASSVYRQTFYAPAANQADSSLLYRLLRSNPFDHMDSRTPDEAGYVTEGPLAWLFNYHFPGTSPINRWYNPRNHDHLTTFAGDRITSGHDKEGMHGYAFQRYLGEGAVMRSVSGREVTIKANLVAGGSIWELWWGGKQFINDWDYGRQLQVAFYVQNDLIKCGGPLCTDNPTEAGDSYGWPSRRLVNGQIVGRNPNQAHGSPLIYFDINGKKLKTSCWPLQWEPEKHGGGGLLGGENCPSMSKMRFSKDVELDFQGRPHLIRWTSSVEFARPSSAFDIELPTAYLDREFRRMTVFDAVTNSEKFITPVQIENGVFGVEEIANTSVGTAGIMATYDGRYALGIYYPKELRNQFSQEISGYAFYRFELGSFSNTEEDKKYDADATKISLILRSRSPIPTGKQTWTAYLMVGNLGNIKQEARRLYKLGL